MFRRLDATRIVETARRLQRRIDERFPGSGLSGVASDIVAVADEALTLSHWLGRPHRVVALGGSLLMMASVIAAIVQRLRSGARFATHAFSGEDITRGSCA